MWKQIALAALWGAVATWIFWWLFAPLSGLVLRLSEPAVRAALQNGWSGEQIRPSLLVFGYVVRALFFGFVFGLPLGLLTALRHSKYLLSDTVKPQSYLSIQSSIPANEPPSTSENRTGFLTQLGDDVIAILKEAVANSPANYIIWLVHFHGAAAAVPVRETAFSLRGQGFGYGITAQWDKPAQRISATHWTISLAKRLAPLSRGSYVNMMDREDAAAVRTAYGPNYERLAKLKRRYDPANLFALNQNIRPA